MHRVVEDGAIRLTTKTGRGRSVDLLPALERALVTHRLEGSGEGLVLGDEEGKPWKDHGYRNWRRRKFKPLTGLNRPYDLRHAFASLLLHESPNTVWVARQLGHRPSLCVDTYGHLIDELGSRRVKAATAVEKARQATLGKEAGPRLAPRASEDGAE